MKQITLQSFLVKYILNFILINSFFLIIISFLNNILSINGIIYILIDFGIPILCSKMASAFTLHKKEILANKSVESVQKKILITQILLGIVTYFMWFIFNVILLFIYMLGVFIGYKIASKAIINNIKTDNYNLKEYNENNTNIVKNEGANIITQYKLERLDDENIIKFLEMNNLNSENYFFATQIPCMSTYAVYGSLGAFTMVNYIVDFDSTYIYLFELSRLSNKNIENCIVIDSNEINYITNKNAVFGAAKSISIRFNNEKKLDLQCNKTVANLKNQEENIQRFLGYYPQPILK